MKKTVMMVLLLTGMAVAAMAQQVYYITEKALLPPLTFVVESVKYSYGTQSSKPNQGYLFLFLNVRASNLSNQEVPFRWKDCLTIHSEKDVYTIDTATNVAVQRVNALKPQEEKAISLSFTVPKKVYDSGALAQIVSGNQKAVIDLRYVDVFEGHLALGLVLADSNRNGEALLEYQKALAGMQKEDEENYNYLTYCIGEAYGKLFIYEEAIAKFKEIAAKGKGVKFYDESSKNLAVLEQRLAVEDKKQRAVRLVEAGYNYGFVLGNNPKALEIYATLKKDYPGILVGAFTTEQVAVLYTALIHINMKNYKEALTMCQNAMADPQLNGNSDFKKSLEETIQQCKDLQKKNK